MHLTGKMAGGSEVPHVGCGLSLPFIENKKEGKKLISSAFLKGANSDSKE